MMNNGDAILLFIFYWGLPIAFLFAFYLFNKFISYLIRPKKLPTKSPEPINKDNISVNSEDSEEQ